MLGAGDGGGRRRQVTGLGAHGRDGDQALEHGGRYGVPPNTHCLRWHVGRHGRPLLLAGGKDVSLAPDDWLTTREHLGHLEGSLHGEGQRLGLSGEGLLGPLGRLHWAHGHVTYGGHEDRGNGSPSVTPGWEQTKQQFPKLQQHHSKIDRHKLQVNAVFLRTLLVKGKRLPWQPCGGGRCYLMARTWG